MWRARFWVTSEGCVLLQAAVDQPYCCTTRLTCLVPSAGEETVVHLVTRGGGTRDVIARPIESAHLAAADGNSVGPETEFPELTHDGAEAVRQVLYSKCEGYPTALIGAPFDGQAIARFLARITGAPLIVHNLVKESRLHDVTGVSHNPNTLSRSSLVAAMREGAVFLVNAREASQHYLELMRSIAKFVESFEPGADPAQASLPAGVPEAFRAHDDFTLVLNFPRGAAAQPPLSPCRMNYVPLKQHCISEREREMGFRHVPTGPNTVLILMMFNVPAYEGWFAKVIEPTVRKYGQCVRVTKNLEEWRTEMRRALLAADTVLVDLSHPKQMGLSPNVIWELSEIQRACFDKKLSRDRLLCFARGLEHVRSREETPDFVFSSDIDPAWIPVRERGSHPEDLLGLRIRRYDPDDPDSVAAFSEWLKRNLECFVQGVPAPDAPSVIQAEARRVLAIPRSDGKTGELDLDGLWLGAIADLDFARLRQFADGEAPSRGVLELTGRLMASVSVTRAVETDGYWSVVKGVIAESSTLLEHYFRLLETEHLLRDTPLTNHFRENLWFVLRHARLQPADLERAKALLKLERDADIGNVAQSVLIEYLPASERLAAKARMVASFWGVTKPGGDESGVT